MMRPVRGASLIDVVVGSFLVLVVFLSLFGLLRASLLVSSIAKARAAATSVATSQLEMVRSLDYDAVGTVGGIPAGSIPQNSTTVLDGYTFNVRTFIGYVDDAADGIGGADVTGITTDYKQAKVSVTYTLNNKAREVALITNIVPPGLETTNGGGTLKIDVVGATGAPVAGATVRVVNTSISPSVNVTTFSSALGVVYLPGALPSSEYQVTVSKSGYSSAQTYARDATNQNPTPGYLTVVKDQTTTGTFAIDTLASLIVRTFSPIESATTTDTFADSSRIVSATNTSVSGGSLILSGASGTYPASGTVRATNVSPSYLVSWGHVDANITLPALTSVSVQVVDGAGTLIPDADLPGNSAGFTTFPVSLTALSTTTYPTLALKASLGTADPLVTPSVNDWAIGYGRGPVPLPDVPFSLQGAKTIGSTGAGAAIYKTNVSSTTNAAGNVTLPLEWDVYGLILASHDVVDACGAPPFTLAPGVTSDNRLILGARTTHAILVTVKDNIGGVVSGASVTLARPGFTQTITTSTCGSAYFGAVSSANDYTVTISKSGYTTEVYTNVPVSGHIFYGTSFD